MRDTIYREDAIKAFDECLETSECGTMLSDEKYLDRLKAIPSADRPRGEWIATTMVDCGAPIWLCSMCEYESYGTYNFCPNCGARMKGADDE